MTRRFIIFVVGAILLLPVGYIGAQMIWRRFHNKHESPASGLYHGSISVTVNNPESVPFCLLTIRAQSSPRWYWRQPTNFAYTTLEVDWRGESQGRATVSLPGFTYRSDSANGAFSHDILARWLYGPTTNQISDTQHVGRIFQYFEAAATGSLPPPRHHTYFIKEPGYVQIHHYLLGYGVGSTVYVWLTAWLFAFVFFGRKVWRGSCPG
jgi:hypothetical protein